MKILPFVRRLSIVDDHGVVIPFRPSREQTHYLSDCEEQLATRGRVRSIILKARQLGMSTATEAMLFEAATVFDNMRGLVVSHEKDSAEHLLGMTKTFYETFPFKPMFPLRANSRKALELLNNNSYMNIATAKNAGAGRSRTLRALHASEVAFWLDGGTLMTGLSQAVPSVPNTFIVLESTANGVGNYFHRQWEMAVSGESEYRPLFYPWFNAPKYTASAIGVSTSLTGKFDDEERVIKRAFGLTDDQLAWRRWAIMNLAQGDIKKFHQEYPSTAQEAFIATGTNVFPLDQLARVYEHEVGTRGRVVRLGDKARFVDEPNGELTIFRYPHRDNHYIIGADPSRTIHGDFAVAQVLNRETLEQVAVYRRRLDPGTFADELFNLGQYYNYAYIAPEKEGPGYMTVGRLMGRNYPHIYKHTFDDRVKGKIANDFGWTTNSSSKPMAISWTIKHMVDSATSNNGLGLAIHDAITYTEMSHYVILENGDFGNANGTNHDDTVMAMAIAIAANHLLGPVYEDTTTNPVINAEAVKAISTAAATGSKISEADMERFGFLDSSSF